LIGVNDADLSLLWIGLGVAGATSLQEHEMSKDLDDLFHETLKYIYYAEKEIHSALPTLAKIARSDALRRALENHKKETQDHITRLEDVFAIIDKSARTEASEAIDGLIAECLEIATEFKGSSAADSAIIAGAQAIEHYEISQYGTLKAWAKKLGRTRAVELLDRTLTEEKHADKTLTELAERALNEKAAANA
jgi:ferritin-like metal-binding protein YciE